MGLDMTELVVGIEESVAVPIPNEVAVALQTPRQLITYLLSHLPQSSTSSCVSQRAFHALRRALIDRLGIARQDLRLATDLASILPPDTAYSAWEDVGRAVGVRQWPRGPGREWLAVQFYGPGPRTVGEVTMYLAGFAACTFKRAGEGWAWREVETIVAWQFAHNLGIEEYALDDRFVEDMGLE